MRPTDQPIELRARFAVDHPEVAYSPDAFRQLLGELLARIEALEAAPKGPPEDDDSKGGVVPDVVDAGRYRYLRNQVRKGGVINERIYVRCDGRYKGLWALDGENLDVIVDRLILGLPVPPVE